MRHNVYNHIDLVQQGKFIESFDLHYAENVSTQENQNPPMVGFQANRDREVAFIATIADLKYYRAESVFVDGDETVIRWVGEYVGTDGNTYHWDEIAVQRWKDGKVIAERFYYDPASLLVAA